MNSTHINKQTKRKAGREGVGGYGGLGGKKVAPLFLIHTKKMPTTICVFACRSSTRRRRFFFSFLHLFTFFTFRRIWLQKTLGNRFRGARDDEGHVQLTETSLPVCVCVSVSMDVCVCGCVCVRARIGWWLVSRSINMVGGPLPLVARASSVSFSS